MTRHKKTGRTFETLNLLWVASIGIAFFIATFILSFNKFVELFNTNKLHFFEAVALALITFFLFMNYWIATHRELRMLADYLNEASAPRVREKTYIVIIILAIFFGTLISVTDKLMFYAGLIVIYDLFDMWGGRQVLTSIEPLIQGGLEGNLSEDDKNIVRIIQHYYFNNPILLRVVTIMFINWIVLFLSLISFYEKGQLSELIQHVAYLILFLNIILGEIVIVLWRIKRNKNIRKIDPNF